jgi:xylan 1,4-beta-xylosidase
MTSRRQLLQLGLVAGAATATASSAATKAAQQPTWQRGLEGQRRADLGDGRYLNPIVAGDHPDPTILKDGEDYYMTFTPFEACPGLTVWHSRDLVNWSPQQPALRTAIGTVLAVDLCKHNGRYFIYIPAFPAATPGNFAPPQIFVIHAPSMQGPWSEPLALGISGFIDPGHVVGEDGRRYLFLSGVSRVRLRADGLATDGPVERVYDGWKYPDEWITEAYALEGPKLLRRGEWFYLISAVGGTAGPPTGHMVIVARSRSIHGPWENCPHNPIVRTRDAAERWWSRGHASLVEGPTGDWWIVYHGYENGYWTLGRQTLLEPITWTDDGWPRALGGDLSQPLAKPRGSKAAAHGNALSDDFNTGRIGPQWSYYAPAAGEASRARIESAALILSGKGQLPEESSPLTCNVGDHAYEFSVDVEVGDNCRAGLLLFYSRRLYCGMGYDGSQLTTYRSGMPIRYWRESTPPGRRLQLRIVNDRNIVTMYYRADGAAWTRHGLRMETSGYHNNTADELLSLRPGLFANGTGEARFRNFSFRALG